MSTTPQLGDTCKNGAVIIDIKKAQGFGHIILCLWKVDTQNDKAFIRTTDPYVTWFATSEDGITSCTSGHYFDTLSDAVVDFNSRV